MKTQTHHFKKALRLTLEFEGVYSNHKHDSGGETKFGITKDTAEDFFGWTGSMKNFPLDLAEDIYHVNYWLKCNLDKVATISPHVAAEIFDTAVNMGTKRGQEILQRSLNLFNRNGKEYKDLLVDGKIGLRTFGALSHVKKMNDITSLILCMNILQGYKYIEFAEAKKTQEVFIRGWLNRVRSEL